ncbi:MAG TPA: hypothetical protein VGD79_10625, partial [Thermoanaerobaculia bacterium]
MNGGGERGQSGTGAAYSASPERMILPGNGQISPFIALNGDSITISAEVAGAMTGLSRLLEHWHAIVTAIGAVAVAAILIIQEVTHYLHPQQTERADPNTYLIVAISILVVALAIRVEQLGHRMTADLKILTDARTEDDVERFKALRRRLEPDGIVEWH